MAGTYPYFADERVILDNADHSNAVFRRCELIYAGGELKLDGALFFDCGISFEGNGERTRDFQEAVFASLYEQGHRTLVLNRTGVTMPRKRRGGPPFNGRNSTVSDRTIYAASCCSVGVAGYDAMKSTIRRAVFKVRERSAFRFVIRFASPIERRPNVDGLSACFEQNRSIWARMSASLASVVTMTEV